MTTLLHLAASPRGPASESLAIAHTFLATFRAEHPEATVDEWNLWDGSLPDFGPDGAGAKMRVFAGDAPVGPQETAWHRARLAFERFAAADLFLFSVPMWNAGVPYILKQFIDVVSQPGMVFDFDPHAGYSGLLKARHAAVIYTSAVYGPGRPASFGSDFQAPYLEDWLRWTGVQDISTIAFRPNLATDDAELGRRQAHENARAIGAEFGPDRLARAS
jgi:FMN-dependent NADH-azoreductase